MDGDLGKLRAHMYLPMLFKHVILRPIRDYCILKLLWLELVETIII
jgi:hypothetical protein